MALVQQPNLDRQSRLDQVVEFPIHGSCSRCHHLHTNRTLHLPLDLQQHTRFNCDNCEHPILGIGRTSTQTTLASIETNGAGHRSWQNEPDVASTQDFQPSPVPLQPLPLRVDTSGNSGPLSTIAEGISPAQQSSALLTPAFSGDLRSLRSTSRERSHRDEEHQVSESTTAITNASVQADSLSKPSSAGFWTRRSQRRFRDRIRLHLRKPRSFNVSTLGLHIDVSPAPSASGRPSPPVAHAQLPSTRDPAKGTPFANMSDLSTPVQSNAISLHSSEPPQQPVAAHPDPLIGRDVTLAEKHERIRALRREATLKRQAERISRCECQSECQCRNGSIQSNAASLGPDSSERSIQVPVHHLQRLLGEAYGSAATGGSSSDVNGDPVLVGVGSHLHLEPIDAEPGTGIALESQHQHFPSDRISQASTVYVRSNGSTGSLDSRRPASMQRPSTTPASIPRRSTDGLRPDLREVMRNQHIPDPGPGPAPEASSSPRSSDSDASRRVVGECGNHVLILGGLPRPSNYTFPDAIDDPLELMSPVVMLNEDDDNLASYEAARSLTMCLSLTASFIPWDPSCSHHGMVFVIRLN
ncbi:MAG: hypothetical protein Q9168_001560 [Polycauliona sp. 1 TL-2023]